MEWVSVRFVVLPGDDNQFSVVLVKHFNFGLAKAKPRVFVSHLHGRGENKVTVLGRRIFLAGRGNTVDYRYADQTDNAHSDPLLWHVQHVGADRQTYDQNDISGDVDPK